MKYLSVPAYEVLLCGMIGALIAMLVKANELRVLAKRSNVMFSFREYFVDDWISHVISTAGVVLFTIIVRRRLNHVEDGNYEFILVISATVGYTGAALISKVFGTVEKKILAAVDHKTTIADKASGVPLDVPTPK